MFRIHWFTIRRNFTQEELDCAYRKKLHEVHPDRLDGSEKDFHLTRSYYTSLCKYLSMKESLYTKVSIESLKKGFKCRCSTEYEYLPDALYIECEGCSCFIEPIYE